MGINRQKLKAMEAHDWITWITFLQCADSAIASDYKELEDAKHVRSFPKKRIERNKK